MWFLYEEWEQVFEKYFRLDFEGKFSMNNFVTENAILKQSLLKELQNMSYMAMLGQQLQFLLLCGI